MEDIEHLFSGYCEPITAEQGEISTASVNTPEVLDYVRSCRPDVVFIVCISQFVKSELANIPRLGTFVYHEGVTPEYRGVHTPFWAIANGDDDKVGYTLLKISEVLDEGPVYAQGATHLHTLKAPLGYIGHGALVEGLEDVAQVFKGLNDGSAQPIDVTGRPNAYYSYFRYSQLKRIFARRREAGIVVGPEQASSFCRLPDL
jgi:methionyl-tRNA formyltransferase